MGFLNAIFGGGGDEAPVAEPLAEPEDQSTRVDPGLDAQYAQAAEARKGENRRRGRSSLIVAGARGSNKKKGNVSILGNVT